MLLNAPPTIGHNIQRAVDEIASANGVSNKVNYLVYSHHHADHVGASSLFDKNVTRIGHEETRKLLLRDDDIRAEPVPDIAPALDLLGVPGSVLDGAALGGLGRALVAARIVAADLGRLADHAPRTAALRAAVPARELETRLAQSLDPEGQVLDGASRGVARARRAVREAIAGGARDVGKVMGQVMPQFKGRADGKVVNQIVRDELSAA